jgi:hypothetical protein
MKSKKWKALEERLKELQLRWKELVKLMPLHLDPEKYFRLHGTATAPEQVEIAKLVGEWKVVKRKLAVLRAAERKRNAAEKTERGKISKQEHCQRWVDNKYQIFGGEKTRKEIIAMYAVEFKIKPDAAHHRYYPQFKKGTSRHVKAREKGTPQGVP